MWRISMWTSSALLMVSVLIGLFGSAVAKNRTCYQCNDKNPECEEKVECKPQDQYCAQMVQNGKFIFKGCSPAEDSFYNDNFQGGTLCPTKTWKEWEEAHVQGRSSSSVTGNNVDAFQQVVDHIKPDDSIKMCYCNTDDCNTKEQLQRSESNSSGNGSGTDSGNGSGSGPGNGSGSGSAGGDSGSGSGNNSGKSSPLSGLMFGSTLAVFFLARRIYGF